MIPLDSAQRYCTAVGMLLIVMIQLRSDEITKTVILAAIGGAASYLITLLIKYLIAYLRKKMR